MDRHDPVGDFDIDYPITAEVSQRIRAILSEAEAAANAIRHSAEQQSQRRRRAAEEEARELLAIARREADALIEERIQRISELSDSLWKRAEGLVGRFEQAEEMRHQLGELTDALARTAAALAREAGHDDDTARRAPEPEAAVRPVAEPEPEPEPVVEPEPEPEPVLDAEPVDDVEIVDAEPPAPNDVDLIAERRQRRQRREAPRETDDADGDQHLAARLVALQMAVAGGNRSEVEGHLRRAFDLDSPRTILDDIFGEGTGPDSRVAWPEPATGGSKS
jgi:hypothetical protein